MTLFALEAVRPASTQLIFAALLGAAGVYCLLPRPKGRLVAVGTFLTFAAFIILGFAISSAYGAPAIANVESILFWVFSSVAVLFGTVLVTQKNPARGAIAFAFVIISVCGLFLLLAAPFLMAATIVVYAGAIIVTFLFVLMLSHAGGPSNENDRTREPLLGSLAGFAFFGLILFGVQRSAEPDAHLPIQPITSAHRESLKFMVLQLDQISNSTAGKSAADIVRASDSLRLDLEILLSRIEVRHHDLDHPLPPPWDTHADRVLAVRNANKSLENSITQSAKEATAALDAVKQNIRLLLGSAELPARNVGTIGMLLYSEHLLAVELAGTLLLVAAIGAVAIAGRKGAVS